MVEGTTENTAVCLRLVTGLRDRGLDAERGMLFVLDGGYQDLTQLAPALERDTADEPGLSTLLSPGFRSCDGVLEYEKAC